jgi:phage shock protein A
VGEPSLVERVVERLERTVDSLVTLPREVRALGRRLIRVEARTGAIELQIVQLRTEMRGGFSAASRELRQAKNDLLDVIDSSSKATQSMFDDVSKDLGEIRKTVATAEEMRRLHNVVLERLEQVGNR